MLIPPPHFFNFQDWMPQDSVLDPLLYLHFLSNCLIQFYGFKNSRCISSWRNLSRYLHVNILTFPPDEQLIVISNVTHHRRTLDFLPLTAPPVLFISVNITIHSVVPTKDLEFVLIISLPHPCIQTISKASWL